MPPQGALISAGLAWATIGAQRQVRLSLEALAFFDLPPDFDQAAGGYDLRLRATTGMVRPAFAW